MLSLKLNQVEHIKKKLNLNNITLIGIDCIDTERLKKAADISCKDISFGSVKLLSSIDKKGFIKINHIDSKESYSEFIIKELNNYVDTEFALIIQYDGYVINADSWTNEFIKYDYIGATWWYNDGMNVGNGGFSLRSKKLIEILSNENSISVYHPEDDVICRKYRKMLEEKYYINFAPEEIASRFSIESQIRPDGYKNEKYNNQFGFHGSIKIIKNNI
jgi:hypothetical protein